MKRRRGNALIETAMFVPLFILLLVGTAEIGRVTYLYYTVHKTLYGMARSIGTLNGANLCDQSDPEVTSAINWALTGNSEGGSSIVNNLTADKIQIRVERVEEGSDIPGECECSLTGCDSSQGGTAPHFVVVSIPDGFPVQVTLPYLLTETLVFRPTVRVPFGGV